MPKNPTNPLSRYVNDFHAFLADLHVPLGASSDRLAENAADFQWSDFDAMAESLHALTCGEVPAVRRFWIERTKGGSKDSDVAVALLWLLAFSPRALRIQVGAYDREQAGEVKLIVKAILAIDAPLNRTLREVVEVQSSRIVAHARTGGRDESVCEILTTDAFGSHGSRPDVVICDELSHVGSEPFMATLLDNADKVPHSLVIIATNAGEVGSWQERWREIAQKSERWHFSVLDKPAPWVSEDDLAESRLRNTAERYARLWEGVWSSGEGDALSVAAIDACTVLPMPKERGYYLDHVNEVQIGGIDLGVKHDHSAICVLSANMLERTVKLRHIQSWRPQDFVAGVVDLMAVEQAILAANKRFGVHGWVYDPWQAQLLAQQLAHKGVAVGELPFTAPNKDKMAKALLSAFTERDVELYPDEALRKDLLRLRVKEAPHGGYRLDAVRDSDGHADRAIAFAIALPTALRMAREMEPADSDPLPQYVDC